VVAAGEVDAGDLQVAAIDVALVERDAAIGCYLLVCAAAHAIIGAFNDCIAFAVREARRAVFCVVDGAPDICFGLDKRLVPVGIELRDVRCGTIFRDGGVLVERVGIVHRCCVVLQRELPIAYVVVGVLIFLAADCGLRQFGAGVMSKGIVHHRTLPCRIAGGGTAKDIVSIGALRYKGGARLAPAGAGGWSKPLCPAA